MQLERARWLASPQGAAALAFLPEGLAALAPTALAKELRKLFAPGEASALAEQVTLRARAAGRLADAPAWLLTAEGLEMMTHPAVAAHRAARLLTFGRALVDLTCGLGGDLRAASDLGLHATGLERDAATATLARANVPAADVAVGDAVNPPFDLSGAVVVIDPARRTGRRFDPAGFSPPWDASLGLVRRGVAGVLKGPPGIDLRHIPPDAEVEFVQLRRSLREAAVWLGEGAEPGLRKATLLPGSAALTSNDQEASAELASPARYVFDPESCVTRAGLVRHLGAALGASLMDPQIAYLTAERPAFHPLAATFEVLSVVPFGVARLRDHLRVAGHRPDDIRRRGFPIEPDELRGLLGRLEGAPITLLLTTIGGKRLVFVVRRLLPSGSLPGPAEDD